MRRERRRVPRGQRRRPDRRAVPRRPAGGLPPARRRRPRPPWPAWRTSGRSPRRCRSPTGSTSTPPPGIRPLTRRCAPRSATPCPPHLVRTALAGGNTAGTLPVTSQLVLPGRPRRTGRRRRAARTIPRSWNRSWSPPDTSGAGCISRRDGQVLTVVLGYDVADERAAATARLVQRQLGVAGIQVELVQQTDADLQQPLTADSVPDLVLRTVPRSASDARRGDPRDGLLPARWSPRRRSGLDGVDHRDHAPRPVRARWPPSGATRRRRPGRRAARRRRPHRGRWTPMLWSSLYEYPIAEPTAHAGPRTGSGRRRDPPRPRRRALDRGVADSSAHGRLLADHPVSPASLHARATVSPHHCSRIVTRR